MNKKVVLKRIFHRDKMRIAIFFDYDEKLRAIVRTIKDSAFSVTHRCFYIDDSEENLKLVLRTLKDRADVDISSIIIRKKEIDSPPSRSDIGSDEIIQPYTEIITGVEHEGIQQQETVVEVVGNDQENISGKYIHDRRNFGPVESQRAHSPLLAAGLASIKIKNSKLGSKIPRSLLRGSSIQDK